jgi:hypothetical protein
MLNGANITHAQILSKTCMLQYCVGFASRGRTHTVSLLTGYKTTFFGIIFLALNNNF